MKMKPQSHRRLLAMQRRQAAARPSNLPRILRRFYVAIAVFLGLLMIGTLGFWMIGDEQTTWSDAIYMTLITVTTVGYEEVVPIRTISERLFTGFIAITGFGNLTFLFTSLTVFFLESDLDDTLRRRRMEKSIRKLSGHYIVCGFGRVGRNVANELLITHRKFVAVDDNEQQLISQLDRVPNLLYLQGDASDDDVLLAADIENAKGVFAVTGDDSRNLMIALTAKQLNPNVRVVARCHDVRNIPKIQKAGADAIVSPDFTGGMRIASAMVRPHVVSFLDEMLRAEHKLRVEETIIPDSFTPRPLKSLALRGDNYIVVAVRHGSDWTFNPPGDFIVHPHHVLIAMATPKGLAELSALVDLPRK